MCYLDYGGSAVTTVLAVTIVPAVTGYARHLFSTRAQSRITPFFSQIGITDLVKRIEQSVSDRSLHLLRKTHS